MSTMEGRLVKVSKRLSRALRHDPAGAGLVLDANGWVEVDRVLAELALSREVLDAVVQGNDKSRFAVERGSDGVERIRASQGHSVPVDLGLAPSTPPAVLYHGTPTMNLASITVEGLVPGRRQHVHLSADVATARSVGARRQLPVSVLTVDTVAMVAAGHAFFVSANGVWLTATVPPAYLAVPGSEAGGEGVERLDP